ncbi:MAG TPA: bifunctional 4-hydroxy-2-oxoglutarate aldolase/2-dehydro-3-deoxy-phosphogluconate aldolase [Steroidobacteraceae bacterium]|nr:bifunctional 4-hydroxy-2-oxoglutarate aldolase/2-dehydro-3-deoxy-phosphogluconate aldolase [Steroidobacteraceae bacterium]
MSMTLADILRRAPVIPVIVIHDLNHAVPLADALVAGGLPVLEVTLRTSVGLAAVEAMRRAVPEAIVGVGTISEPAQFAACARAGAQFGVAPGLTPALLEACQGAEFPFLPGVATASELMRAREAGFRYCKLFPAQQAGGTGMLRALHSVFPDVGFCPTGGIHQDNVQEYLALPNVLCVGGSWVAPAALMKSGDWLAIRKLAQQAAALTRAAA